MIKLKSQNIELTGEYTKNIFAYLVDISPTIFEKYSKLLSYSRMMTECTFIPIGNDKANMSIQTVRDIGHTYWDDQFPILEQNPNIQFTSIHFSYKYAINELKKFAKSFSRENDFAI